jgi:tRNA nucleotidyltransferase (CCA-adding enzyme)
MVDKYVKILESVKDKIRPDNSILVDVDSVVDRINKLLKKSKLVAECVKGGSIAKGTFLKNDYDIDLFVRYNQSYIEYDISELTEKILKILCKELKVKKLDRIHGSRDYFQFEQKKKNKILNFEVIPVILVHAQNHNEALNITDLSPEHVTWVKKYTDKNSKLTDEIRLAKQFCKTNGVYGAESYVNGFSGHILDILIIYYGSFINLLKAFSKYEDISVNKPIIIDPEKHQKNPLKDLNQSKISPLIIIDPIQTERNSAAALSREKLIIFIDAAKRFLEKPSKDFFEIKKFEIKKDISEKTKNVKVNYSKTISQINIVQANIETLDGSKDVVGTKVLKVYETLIEQMQLNDFKVLASNWNFIFDKRFAEMYFIVDKNMSKEVEQEGPPISAKIDYEKFLKKHTELKHKTCIKGNRIYAVMPRKYVDPKIFLQDLCKQEFISRRTKNIKII